MSRVATTLALLFLLSPTLLGAQERDPCASPLHSAFDFWIGQWEVRRADGDLVGHNTIREMAGRCGLAERWRGTSGSRGESLNWVDPLDGRWHQLWVDNTGLVLRLSGGPHDGGIRMEGRGRDTTRLQRITWTPLDDGRVRQHWEVSDDEGRSWSQVFDGYYSRLPSPETADVGADRCDTPQGRAFDFWPGEWRVESRRRGPDGGWLRTDGVWHAERVLGGCGFLDTTTGDYGAGAMSGMGSRFYDPETDRWIVTWVSTLNPGKMGVWEGRFAEDGSGAFYRDTSTPDGPARSRIRWTDVADDSAEWDYAVSSDGGESWQVLWEMTFERLAPGGGR